MQRSRARWKSIGRVGAAGGLLTVLLTGCGQQYVLLHPAGPVAAKELHLAELAAVAMGIVIVCVFILFAVTVSRYRDRPNNPHPFLPDWHGSRWMEVLWFVVPAVLLAIIAVPTVQTTYALSTVPKSKDPLVIDVTSLDWKWLFQYPDQHIATVNYLEIPTHVPVLFELTANSPMNTFWVPQLGGMEYTMPGRVLPLWLSADKPGVYWGRSANFSGTEFEKMFFHVRAVPEASFRAWANTVRRTAPPMTLADYRRLLQFNAVGVKTYGAYPRRTFPEATHGFTLKGGMYMLMSNNPRHA